MTTIHLPCDVTEQEIGKRYAPYTKDTHAQWAPKRVGSQFLHVPGWNPDSFLNQCVLVGNQKPQ